MKDEKIELEREKLENKKKEIKFRHRLLRQKERKLETKKLIELGRLILKSGINELDPPTLTGAFSEILERSKDPTVRNAWDEKGKLISKEELKSNDQPLAVIFSTEPPNEAKILLKQLRFRWNAFRKEWYGRGKISEIEKAVANFNGKVELVID